MSVFRRLWQRVVGRPADPVAAFRPHRDEWVRRWFAAAAAAGKPRGLMWLGFEVAGEPLFVRDGVRVLALVPAVVRFEPVPDGELADVPQAREPRTVIAVFEFRRGAWETDGRTVFNLSPQQLVEREPNRYRPLTEEQP